MIFEIKNGRGKNLMAAINEEAGSSSKMRTPCGGRGICGACYVKLIEGRVSENSIIKEAGETIRACKSEIQSDLVRIELGLKNLIEVSKIESGFSIITSFGFSEKHGNTVAIDIGTTTVALIMFENSNGNILYSNATVNRQAAWADNVLERINCSNDPEKLALMHAEIINTIEPMLTEIDGRFSRVFVTGNTSMLHLLCNVDPSSMGKFPFTPVFLNARTLQSKEFFGNLLPFDLTILPSASSFIGADVIGGLIAADFENSADKSLFIDIGTNGEIVLKDGGQYYSASAAAGPAFEGYGLSCGMRGGEGAISEIRIGGDFSVDCKTIGDIAPIGICGSAYIDFLAAGRQAGLLESSGRFSEKAPLLMQKGAKAFIIADGVYITEADIANLLKAKAAIHAAVLTLLQELKLEVPGINKVFIAGGFGRNINLQNAYSCGLIPEFKCDPLFLGNSALGGAYLCALDNTMLKRAQSLAGKIQNMELNTSAFFEDFYIDAMFLN